MRGVATTCGDRGKLTCYFDYLKTEERLDVLQLVIDFLNDEEVWGMTRGKGDVTKANVNKVPEQ